MRILHIMLACFYNEGYTYQENILPKMHKMEGHEVKIITSTEVFIQGNQLGYIEPMHYINKDGIEIVRLPYNSLMPHCLAKKIRKYKGTYQEIEKFKPDIIFVHGMQTEDLKQIIKYKKQNKRVIIFADSHEDFNNSATNFLSKCILHKMFYSSIIRKAVPFIEKILYISYETKEFLQSMYNLDENLLEYYPLGGIIYPDDKREEYREKIRNKLQVREDEILLVHSGKFDENKRTKELINAFSKAANKKLKLVLIGKFDETYRKIVEPLFLNNEQIIYEGWKGGEELLQYLCACDLYVQPGSQSATMQNALCCKCAVMLTPVKSHYFLLRENAFYINNEEDITNILKHLTDKNEIIIKQERAFEIAKNKLDYSVLAKRIIR